MSLCACAYKTFPRFNHRFGLKLLMFDKSSGGGWLTFVLAISIAPLTVRVRVRGPEGRDSRGGTGALAAVESFSVDSNFWVNVSGWPSYAGRVVIRRELLPIGGSEDCDMMSGRGHSPRGGGDVFGAALSTLPLGASGVIFAGKEERRYSGYRLRLKGRGWLLIATGGGGWGCEAGNWKCSIS